MKKFYYIVLCAILLLSMVGCYKVNSQQSIEGSVDDKVLVVYFSRTGNTRTLAEYAAQYYSADIYEIVAKVPYTEEDIDYNNSSSRTSIEQNDAAARPEIEGKVDNMADYNVIVLAYPIWWGQAPRIINTFLESYDLAGKTIIPCCTSASSGIGSSAENLHKHTSESVTWVDGKRFAAGASKADIARWLEEVYPTTH